MSESLSKRRPLAIVILAAGLGTRMKSDLPKVLHPVCGRPLISFVCDTALALEPERTVVVIGPDQPAIAEVLPLACEVAIQQQRRGTGDAVIAALETLAGFVGDVIVLVGDAPLISLEFLEGLVAAHSRRGAGVTVATAVLDEGGHYGRIIRDDHDHVLAIVEARDATPEQLLVNEVNTGFFVFDAGVLERALGRIDDSNDQHELYLTDTIQWALREGAIVEGYRVPSHDVMMAVNSRVELAEVNGAIRRRLLEELMLAGVTIEDPSSTYVDWGVTVGRDTFLRANTHLTGKTKIGSGCEIGPGSFLSNVSVDDGARVIASHLYDCEVGARCSVGPFAYLRPGTILMEGAKAGTFVELKKSTIGPGSKVPHLSYVGDTIVGRNSNIAAGNITANYDGYEKHETRIGDNVRTGSDTTMVAPVTIGNGAFTAAGSVITADVPAGSLAVARSRQENVAGYADRLAARHDKETPRTKSV